MRYTQFLFLNAEPLHDIFVILSQSGWRVCWREPYPVPWGVSWGCWCAVSGLLILSTPHSDLSKISCSAGTRHVHQQALSPSQDIQSNIPLLLLKEMTRKAQLYSHSVPAHLWDFLSDLTFPRHFSSRKKSGKKLQKQCQIPDEFICASSPLSISPCGPIPSIDLHRRQAEIEKKKEKKS